MPPDPPFSSPAERRAWVRYPCNLRTLYQPGGNRLDQHWWFAKVRDISTHGIGMILERSFDPGTRLTIALYSSDQDISRTVEAIVVHMQPQDGRYVVGCTFDAPIEENELQAFWSDQRLSQAVKEMSG